MGPPELETLDQLLCGDMPLSVIRSLYPDDAAFMSGLFGLLNSGDVRLFGPGKPDIPKWYWRELFVEGKILDKLGDFRLDLTDQGARRIG
jgi:hypothetical protein